MTERLPQGRVRKSLQLQRAEDATERLVAKQAANRDELDRAELAVTERAGHA